MSGVIRRELMQWMSVWISVLLTMPCFSVVGCKPAAQFDLPSPPALPTVGGVRYRTSSMQPATDWGLPSSGAAVSLARAACGARENDWLMTRVELVDILDDTTPFLAGTVTGRILWRVEFQRTDSEKNLDGAVRRQVRENLTVFVDPSRGLMRKEVLRASLIQV